MLAFGCAIILVVTANTELKNLSVYPIISGFISFFGFMGILAGLFLEEKKK